ncbi:WD40-repeat-containing domain protein [Chytriomyces sp. MP71]|nr:WD40-repeat-containing domain protein [Chytriomyces sp. MP71]
MKAHFVFFFDFQADFENTPMPKAVPDPDDYTDYDELEADDEDYYGDQNDDDIEIDEHDEVADEQGDEEILLGLKRVDTWSGFFQHKEPVYSVCVREDVVVTGGGDDKAFVWSASSGDVVRELAAHTDSVVACGFSADGQFLATGGMDGRVIVYQSFSGEQILLLEGPSEVTWLNWHPRGNALLCGSADGTLWMWSIPSGQCMNVFTGHASSVSCGQFSPDGKSIVSGGDDGLLFNWDPRNATVKTQFRPDDARFLNGAPVTSIAVHADSQVVLAGGQDGSSCLVHLVTGKPLGSISKAEDSVESVGFSPHLPLAAVSSVDGTIAIWDISLMRLRETQRHAEGVTKTLWLKSTPLMVSSSLDKSVRLWDMRTGTFVRSFYGHTGPILDMALGTDEGSVVTCSEDGSAQVFLLK